jgi:hypothetical protein
MHTKIDEKCDCNEIVQKCVNLRIHLFSPELVLVLVLVLLGFAPSAAPVTLLLFALALDSFDVIGTARVRPCIVPT